MRSHGSDNRFAQAANLDERQRAERFAQFDTTARARDPNRHKNTDRSRQLGKATDEERET